MPVVESQAHSKKVQEQSWWNPSSAEGPGGLWGWRVPLWTTVLFSTPKLWPYPIFLTLDKAKVAFDQLNLPKLHSKDSELLDQERNPN